MEHTSPPEVRPRGESRFRTTGNFPSRRASCLVLPHTPHSFESVAFLLLIESWLILLFVPLHSRCCFPGRAFRLISFVAPTQHEAIAMARQKQRIPLQRLPSSEIMEELPDEPVAKEQWMRGLPSKAVTSLANGAVQLPPMLSQALPDPPGLTQLVICVLGIYASLYVINALKFSVINPTNVYVASLGHSSKNVSPPRPTDRHRTPNVGPSRLSLIRSNRSLPQSSASSTYSSQTVAQVFLPSSPVDQSLDLCCSSP